MGNWLLSAWLQAVAPPEAKREKANEFERKHEERDGKNKPAEKEKRGAQGITNFIELLRHSCP